MYFMDQSGTAPAAGCWGTCSASARSRQPGRAAEPRSQSLFSRLYGAILKFVSAGRLAVGFNPAIGAGVPLVQRGGGVACKLRRF